MKDGYIVSITPEIAVHQSIRTYSGGQGFVLGDASRAAQKLGLKVIFFCPLYREGYYDQGVDEKGMTVRYIYRDYDHILKDTGIAFPITINTNQGRRDIWIKVWKLPGETFNTTDVYFLDADINENDYLSRLNTRRLYGGTDETKLVLSLIMAKGTLKACELLNLPVRLFHLQESHTAFCATEIFNTALEKGMDYEKAKQFTQSQIVFTTHTPIEAGNPRYSFDMVKLFSMYGDHIVKLGWDQYNMFNMTLAAMRLAKKVNAVSQKHSEIANNMWRWVKDIPEIIPITNGQDTEFWQYPEFAEARTEEDMMHAKMIYKQKMIEYIADMTGVVFDPKILTLVFARRFAEYKRPRLLFTHQFPWLEKRLYANEIQLVFAGKPHPNYEIMVEAWNRIYRDSKRMRNLVILPGYELELSKILKGGADVWVNTPRIGEEASGTSGMGAAKNGSLNMSTIDGWMCEANEQNCFLFGKPYPIPNQDAMDAEALTECTDHVNHMYHSHKSELYKKALSAKTESETRWPAVRMMREYDELLYN